MKERPILFSGEMVRAILDGRKTQTRRVIKGRRIYPDAVYEGFIDGQHQWYESRDGIVYRRNCPYGVPGDRLWVRESWRIMGLLYEEEPCIQYKADLAEQPCYVPDDWLDMRWEDWYERQSAKLVEDCKKAGLKPNNDYDELYRWERDTCPTRWQSPIYLPRFANRLTLEITDVRVERLQEISEAGAIAEGVHETSLFGLAYSPKLRTLTDERYGTDQVLLRGPIGQFALVWDSLNAKRGYGWDMNPWGWGLEFTMPRATQEGANASPSHS